MQGGEPPGDAVTCLPPGNPDSGVPSDMTIASSMEQPAPRQANQDGVASAGGSRPLLLPRRVLVILINLFFISCIFDPADQLFRLKMPLFGACWAVFALFVLPRVHRYRIPLGLVFYVGTMIAIPAFSVAYYLLNNGQQPFEGFALFKSYMMCSFTILLFLSRVDALRPVAYALSFLAVAVIGVYALSKFAPGLFGPVDQFLNRYGIANVNVRDYSSDVELLLVLFATSPMLVLSVAYFTNFALVTTGWRRIGYGLLAGINIAGMFLAGTRSNLFTAVLLPLVLVVMRVRRKFIIFLCAGLGVFWVALAYWEQLAALFSAREHSNQHKLVLMEDYWRIFSDPMTLLLGQGLGAYQYWTPRGFAFPVTELTYFDVIRFYGVFLGGIILWLMFYPVIYAFLINPHYTQKHIIVGYAFYLAACFGQPLFFSSSGMSILSIILANIFLYSHRRMKFFQSS